MQRDFDGTPMVTDLMTEEEILTFAKILADRDEGFIELAYQETGEEGEPMAAETMKFFERVAETAKRPILYQTVTTDDTNPGTAPVQAALAGGLRQEGSADARPRPDPQRRYGVDFRGLEPVR